MGPLSSGYGGLLLGNGPVLDLGPQRLADLAAHLAMVTTHLDEGKWFYRHASYS